MKARTLLIVGLLAASAVAASAHHSTFAEYDGTKPFKLTGNITMVEWINPHGWVYVDVNNDKGEVEHWQLQFGAPNELIRSGWKRTDLEEGEEVTIQGFLAKKGDFTGTVRSIALPGGRQVFNGTGADGGASGSASIYGWTFVLSMLGIVGLPGSDEFLVSSGHLIWLGWLHPAGTFLAALAGVWCGTSLSYGIGRTLGVTVVRRFGKRLRITQERLDRMKLWFEGSGRWALVFGYFIPGVRHFTAIVAGASSLEAPILVTYAWPGGLLWVATFLALGYLLGDDRQITDSIHRYVLYVSIASMVAASCYFLRRRKVHKSD